MPLMLMPMPGAPCHSDAIYAAFIPRVRVHAHADINAYCSLLLPLLMRVPLIRESARAHARENAPRYSARKDGERKEERCARDTMSAR